MCINKTSHIIHCTNAMKTNINSLSSYGQKKCKGFFFVFFYSLGHEWWRRSEWPSGTKSSKQRKCESLILFAHSLNERVCATLACFPAHTRCPVTGEMVLPLAALMLPWLLLTQCVCEQGCVWFAPPARACLFCTGWESGQLLGSTCRLGQTPAVWKFGNLELQYRCSEYDCEKAAAVHRHRSDWVFL